MKPEEGARQNLDKQLTQSGWIVQRYKNINLSAGLGIAVCEYPTESSPADYILFIDRKPVGVIEAKKEGHTLARYITKLPDTLLTI
jgi:type I restriction enzyme R subunit